jgi:outer membrane protein assembly factor BamD
VSVRACRRIAFAALGVALLGCPKTLPPDLGPDELFQRGREAWEDERWLIARTAFERLLFLADTHFREKAYLTAATEYLKLAQTRPTIDLADDARYRACRAYSELSPRPELDQKYAEEAVAECRSLVVLYPQSPLVASADSVIARMRNKLAEKLYLNAKYYMDRAAYDSAVLYLNDVLKTYPESAVVPAALLGLYDAYQRIGYDEEAAEARERLLREHPTSPEARSLAPSPTATRR